MLPADEGMTYSAVDSGGGYTPMPGTEISSEMYDGGATPDDAAALEAKRQAQNELISMQGRASTNLSGDMASKTEGGQSGTGTFINTELGK